MSDDISDDIEEIAGGSLPVIYRDLVVGRYDDISEVMESIPELFGVELELLDCYSHWKIVETDELDRILSELIR
ncbi:MULTISPECIES: hypothetical protein [unclassified Aeromonas]|uniref:hypothetical protein n=1 Tax=unclassified Aeromonas TaxID=257493 RepID=UPI00084AFA70|nr:MULTISPECIES: hypothetical protein [unclassified Aeromonas]OEC41379.1 hypothetical protein A9G06_13775 [Aeromonas sp. DNP9]OEC48745.1 hypothetical protein A9G04_20910 [Aeromonas sp. ANNP30]OEC60786.1 hypothetical protein A9G49_20975 [Aeromonas sp. ANP5]